MLRKKKSHEGTLNLGKGKRNKSAQRIAGRDDRLNDDHGGHLIGSQFEGAGGLENLVAMNKQVNGSGGKCYKMEQEWASALNSKPPKKVDVKIKPIYSGGSLRPDKFEVVYTIGNGRTRRVTIRNQSGG